MDHASMEQDREDLARYRAGLLPATRKEIVLPEGCIMTPEQVTAANLKILSEVFEVIED